MSDLNALHPDDPDWIGDYRVENRLGKGRLEPVYRAIGPYGEAVAIRQPLVHPGDERARRMLAQEVATARLVAPLCTAQILDVNLEGPRPYVVSEYIDGPSLCEHLERHGPMAGIELQRLALGTIIAIAALHHAGLIHPHLKPANVILAEDGPRLVDFGTRLPPRPGGWVNDMLAWASIIEFAATGQVPGTSVPTMAAKDCPGASGDLDRIPAELMQVLGRVRSDDPGLRPNAQQALALLLGRSAPVLDLRDPTPVLAEAAWLVRAAHRTPVREFTAPGRS